MIHKFLVILCAFNFTSLTAFGYAAGPEEVLETQSLDQQNQLASRFGRCFQRHLDRGWSRVDAGAICGQQVRNSIETNENTRSASWQFLICLEEQSSGNGVSMSSVVGLCRTLLSSLEGVQNPSEEQTSQL